MKRWAALAMAGLALACAPAAGAADPDPSPSIDSRAPIDITANEAEVVVSKCMTVWKGAAEALQGKTRLRANTISVFAKPNGTGANGQQSCGETERLEAEGNVYFVTPTQNAHGDRAVYTAAADEVVLTGDVVVVQGNDVARGDRLTIKVSTRDAHIESNAKGAGQPNRVRGVFYPTAADTGQPAAPGAAPPAAQP